LDSSHFLCATRGPFCTLENDCQNHIVLFILDVARMQCIVVDTHIINEDYTQIHVNSVDPRKFLLCFNDENYEEFAYKGHLNENDKLEIGDETFSTAIIIVGRGLRFYQNIYNYAGMFL
jgi:hypothetical protein